MKLRLKKWTVLFVLWLVGPACSAFAQDVYREIVHEKTKEVDLLLNSSTVLCSRADYGVAMLKVLVPQLASLTILDHRNEGAGAPCVSAGRCRSGDGTDPGYTPGDILQPGAPEVEKVAVTVKLTRITNPKRTGKCDVHFEEEVRLVVRGIPFSHTRYAHVGERNIEDCGPFSGGRP